MQLIRPKQYPRGSPASRTIGRRTERNIGLSTNGEDMVDDVVQRPFCHHLPVGLDHGPGDVRFLYALFRRDVPAQVAHRLKSPQILSQAEIHIPIGRVHVRQLVGQQTAIARGAGFVLAPAEHDVTTDRKGPRVHRRRCLLCVRTGMDSDAAEIEAHPGFHPGTHGRVQRPAFSSQPPRVRVDKDVIPTRERPGVEPVREISGSTACVNRSVSDAPCARRPRLSPPQTAPVAS